MDKNHYRRSSAATSSPTRTSSRESAPFASAPAAARARDTSTRTRCGERSAFRSRRRPFRRSERPSRNYLSRFRHSRPRRSRRCIDVQTCYEPFIGRRLASASRLAERKVPTEKLPAVLRGVGACQLRYAVCCGALFVFEVLWGDSRPLRKGALLISCHGNTSTLIKTPKLSRKLFILAF